MHVLDESTRRFGRLLHYAGLLVIVLCATAGYAVVYAPAMEKTAQAEMRIVQLLLSVQNAPVIRERHRQTTEKLEDVRSRIAKVRERVPPSAEAGEFLKEITRIASDEQLVLRDFHPSEGVKANGYTEFEVMLTGKGSFASICTFFDRMSKLKRLSKVRSLTISARSMAEYPIEATLIIYYGLQHDKADQGREVRRG